LIRECIAHYANQQREEYARWRQGTANIFEELVIFSEKWDEAAALRSHQMLQGLKKYYPDIFYDFAKNRYYDGMQETKAKLVLGVEQGLILDTVDIDLAVSVLAHSMSGLIRRNENASFVWPSDVSFSEAVHYIIIHFFRGIATEKGIKIIDDTILKPKNR
jgi:hypothetical protein